MACYEASFAFLYVDVFIPHRKHAYGPPRPVTRMALLLIITSTLCNIEVYNTSSADSRLTGLAVSSEALNGIAASSASA
jgi:hypothetical protein